MPMDPDGFVMKTSFVQDEDIGLHVETSSDDDVSALIHLGYISGDSCNWHQILHLIHRNPSLLTQEIFFKALQQNPPQPVVRQMLSVAPPIASLPPSGPTALQVALQSGASLGVIQALLEVSPFALCVTRSYDAIDPLSYAKQHRSKETDLIELLSRPLSYWLSQGAFHPIEGRTHPSDTGQVIPKPTASPVGPASPEQPSLPLIDRQEMDNVKCLCAQVLKGHKRLAKQLELFQAQLHEKNESSSTKRSSAAAQRVLETLKEEQNKQFRIQLLALDLKERAFDARAKEMEERCQDQFDEQLTQWKKTHEYSLCTRDISELTDLLDREVSMNEQCHRERSQPLQVDCWQDNQAGQEVVLWEKNHFPGFFPMNLAELEEATQLNVTSTSLSDASENPDTAEPPSPSRRPWGIGRFRHPREPSVRRCFLSF